MFVQLTLSIYLQQEQPMGSELSECTACEPCLQAEDTASDTHQRRIRVSNVIRLLPKQQSRKAPSQKEQPTTGTIGQKGTDSSEVLRQRKMLAARVIARMGLPEDEGGVGREQKMRLVHAITNICLNGQTHLLQVLESRPAGSFLQSFLQSIEQAELDQLDMLHHNEGIFREQQLLAEISSDLVSIREWMQDSLGPGGSRYQRYKKTGWEMIKEGKVCFFVMAAGKSSRFNSGDRQQKGQPNHRPLSKEFTPLDIPSNRCILEIILARLSALAEKCQCSLTVYLSLNPAQVESLQSLLKTIEKGTNRLVLYPFTCKTRGALDLNGKVVIEDSGLPSLWPTGTADFLNVLQGDQTLQFPDVDQLMKSGVEYIQFMGCSNLVEKCFDCFALGLAKAEDLDYATKVVAGPIEQERSSPRIYETSQRQPYVCDAQQFPSNQAKSSYSFINSSLFKLKYLRRRLKQESSQSIRPRKKIHQVQHRPPFSQYQTVVSYQQDYTDLFRKSSQAGEEAQQGEEDVQCGRSLDCYATYSQPQVRKGGSASLQNQGSKTTPEADRIRGRLLLCDACDYAPLIWACDMGPSCQGYLNLHKAYLGLPSSGRSRVQLDPFISLQGQNLQQLREQLIELEQEEDIYIERAMKTK